MAGGAYETRPAMPEDAATIVALATACFRESSTFAPAGWEPPSGEGAEERVRSGLRRPGARGEIAWSGAVHAGHMLWLPASATARLASADPTLAHLWHLFLRPEHRGTGLGTSLLAAGVRQAAADGFTTMRLFTPAGQARARRFYEREGWTEVGPSDPDPELRLPIVEYQRSLDAGPRQNDPR